jgi:hypothetical protein
MGFPGSNSRRPGALFSKKRLWIGLAEKANALQPSRAKEIARFWPSSKPADQIKNVFAHRGSQMEVLIFLVIAIAVWALISSYLKKKRREALLGKYGDEQIADMIMKRMFWQGQTAEQLLDSLGTPVDVDKKVLKTKAKEIWKYHQTGKGRYRLRITLENGGVVGWDKKS